MTFEDQQFTEPGLCSILKAKSRAATNSIFCIHIFMPGFESIHESSAHTSPHNEASKVKSQEPTQRTFESKSTTAHTKYLRKQNHNSPHNVPSKAKSTTAHTSTAHLFCVHLSEGQDCVAENSLADRPEFHHIVHLKRDDDQVVRLPIQFNTPLSLERHHLATSSTRTTDCDQFIA